MGCVATSMSRSDVLSFPVRAQQLDRDTGADTAVLDIGVQETGADGALWALAIRGVDVSKVAADRISAEAERLAAHRRLRLGAVGFAA